MNSRVVRNISTTYASRVIAMGSVLVLVPLVANRVGADAYGLYALTVAVVAIFQNDLGMSSALTRFIARSSATQDSGSVRSYAAAGTVFFVGIGILMAGIATLSFSAIIPTLDEASVPSGAASTLAVISVASILTSLTLAPHRQVLAGVGRLDLANAVSICQAILRVLMTVLVLVAGGGIIGVALVDLAAVLLGGCATWLLRRILHPEASCRIADIHKQAFRDLVGLGIDLLVMSVAAVVILQSGSMIVSLILPISMVAIYSVAQRVFTLSREVTNSLTAALLPEASRQHALVGTAALTNFYVRGTRLTNGLLILLLVPLITFMPIWLESWVGADLAAAATTAQILVASMLVNNQHLLAIPMLGAQGRLRVFSVLHLGWMVLSVAGGFLLGRVWGVEGVAAGFVAPILLLEPLYLRHGLSRLGVRWRDFLRDSLAPSILSCLVPAVVLFSLGGQAQSLPQALAGTLAWIVVAGALEARFVLSPSDRTLLLSLLLHARSRNS